MHYFQFNIGDWMSHTAHLTVEEELAYFKLTTWQYLHEKPIPLDHEIAARAIGMRSHSDCIATVLQEFFERTNDGFISKRIMREIKAFRGKSEKARRSAKSRWDKEKDANAKPTQSEGNANHKPITNNQISKGGRFTPPTVSEVEAYCLERKNGIKAQAFVDYYAANGWMRGKNKIKDWKACIRTWESRQPNGKTNEYTAGVI